MKKAFTLAEVLITLGIIGVVASLTLPSLIQNHQKSSLEVATKKFYSMMSQAIKHYMADEGVDDLRNTSLVDMNDNDASTLNFVKSFVERYFKTVKVCDDFDCFDGIKYKSWIEDEGLIYSLRNSASFITTDGMIFSLSYGIDTNPMEITVDVNGKKGPNKIGYDLWTMDIFYDGSIDESGVNPECKKGIASPDSGSKCGLDWGNTQSDVRDNRFDYCKSSHYGGCFGHFLENNFKFDY